MDDLLKARHDAADTLFSMVDLPSTVVDSSGLESIGDHMSRKLFIEQIDDDDTGIGSFEITFFEDSTRIERYHALDSSGDLLCNFHASSNINPTALDTVITILDQQIAMGHTAPTRQALDAMRSARDDIQNLKNFFAVITASFPEYRVETVEYVSEEDDQVAAQAPST